MELIKTAFADNLVKTADLRGNYGFGDIDTLGQGYSRLVMPAFEIAGVAVIIYLLIGAFKFMTSGGDKEAKAQAQAMITHAIIGFVLLMLLFLIIQLVPEFLGMSETFNLINRTK